MDRKTPVFLVFGFLPVSKGGKNKGGIAFATYHLHSAICSKETGNFKTCYIATDYNKRKIIVDNMTVYGFFPGILFSLFFTSFFSLVNYYFRSGKSFFTGGSSRFTAFKLFCVMHYYIKKKKPEFVHVHGALAGAVLNRLSISNNFKKIIRIHGLNTKAKTNKNYNQLIKLEKEASDQSWDGFTFLSQQNLEEWCLTYNTRIGNKIVFNNGFDYVLFNPNIMQNIDCIKKEKNTIKLLTVGVISINKGQLRVLEAISKCKNPTDFEYYCIGFDSHDFVPNLERFAKDYKISFQYEGYISQMELASYYAQCDYLIQPSMMEGFGMVILECIACGVPVIVPSDMPIAKEKDLLNNINSIIIDNSSVTSITKALDNLEKIQFSRKEIFETVKDKTWDNIAIEYIKYIKTSKIK